MNIYPENMRHRRWIALSIPVAMVLQALGIMNSLGFDLMRNSLNGYPCLYILLLIGGIWLGYGIYSHRFQ